MSNPPIMLGCQQFMSYFNMQPSVVKGVWNSGTQYYKRVLYNKAFSVFEFTLPKTWKMNWFRYWLFQYGSIGVVYSSKYGWIDQPYSVEKLDYQYNPKVILVYNSYIDNPIRGVIGVNAGLVHLFDDYYGIDTIVTRYAEMLAQVDKDININLMNSNVAYLFKVDSKKKAQEIRAAYEEATEGKPLVVIGKDVLLADDKADTLLPDVKRNFIVLDLIESRRGIINAFLTEIGIRNVSVQKKERLTSGEYSENNDETKALVEIMYENLKQDFEDINKISGLNLGVKLRYDYVSRETSPTLGNVSRETSGR